MEAIFSDKENLKNYRDFKNIIDTAKIEAIEKRDIEIIVNSIKAGLDSQTISSITGISIENIEKIRKTQ